MPRRLPSVTVHLEVGSGSAIISRIEVSGAKGKLLVCSSVYAVEGASLSTDGGCNVVEPVHEVVKLELRVPYSGELLPAAPTLAVLPVEASNPFMEADTVIVVDSPPTVTAIGLEYERRTVISSTMRTLLEGKQPPQLILWSKDVKHGIPLPLLAQFTAPVHTRLAEEGLLSWPEADQLVYASECERDLGYGFRSWGLCLLRSAFTTTYVLRSLGEAPLEGLEGIRDRRRVWMLSRSWAHVAVRSAVDPSELATEAVKAGIFSTASLLGFERLAGRLAVHVRLSIPMLVGLRSSRSGFELNLKASGYTVLDDWGWDSYSVECPTCWRPLT